MQELSGHQIIDSLDPSIADRLVSIFHSGKDLKEPERQPDDRTVLQQDPFESASLFEGLGRVWAAFGEHDVFQDALEKPYAGLLRSFPVRLTTRRHACVGLYASCQVVVTDHAGHGLKAEMDQEIGRSDFARCAFAEAGVESQLSNLISIQARTSQ